MVKALFCGLILTFLVVGCSRSVGERLALISPTIYYKPVIYKEKDICTSSELRDLVDENGKILISLCKKNYDNCLLQGSCYIVEGERTRNFNFTKKKDGLSRFAEKKEARCPYGYGVLALCLDPFYSVAADLNVHRVGDVIFVPKLVGLRLPDGMAHTGYLVVRDQGGAIIGEDRFDFFTGFFGPFDKGNVFARLGLGDKNHRFGYQKVSDDIAKTVREYRNYPNIP
jgi:3D domain-containing protein